MGKYGLQLGIEGSEASHISTSQYYRDIFVQKGELQNNISNLVYQQQQAEQELTQLKKKIKQKNLKVSSYMWQRMIWITLVLYLVQPK